MPELPMEIITIVAAFSSEFTRPTWKNIQLLLIGAILCRGATSVSPFFEKPSGTSKSPEGTKKGDKYASGGPGRPGPP